MVNRDRSLDKGIDLVGPAELSEALDPLLQVGAHTVGLGLRIQRQDSVTRVGILVVSLRELSIESFALARSEGTGAESKTNDHDPAARQPDNDSAETIHGGLVR